MREITPPLTPEELEQTCREIEDGLQQMLVFEKELHRFDKETLSLLLTLITDPANYDRILHLLENLAPMSRD